MTFVYVECDVPEGMTLAQWRKSRRSIIGRRRWWRWFA